MSGYDHQNHYGLPPTVPPPEWVHNTTCYSPWLSEPDDGEADDAVSVVDVFRSLVMLATAALALAANLIFLVTINGSYYRQWAGPQGRLILTAMASADLVAAVSVVSLGVYSNLFECWPFGEAFCQIQGSLSEFSALILIVLAMERYVSSVYPFSYTKVCSTQICFLVIALGLAASLTFYAAMVFHPTGFHFNANGLMLCEPYHLSDMNILASTAFYFPTTMILMYCYGTIFHATKASQKYRKAIFTTLPMLAGQSANAIAEKFMERKRRNDLASRCSAAISLAFIITVTPWALQQVITSCTRTTAPPTVDFLTSWLASTHSFWSPVIYWALNEKFRAATARVVMTKVLCRPEPIVLDEENFVQVQRDAASRADKAAATQNPTAATFLSTASAVSANAAAAAAVAAYGDEERERHWGEILERSFSARSLHQQQAAAGLASPVAEADCCDEDVGIMMKPPAAAATESSSIEEVESEEEEATSSL